MWQTWPREVHQPSSGEGNRLWLHGYKTERLLAKWSERLGAAWEEQHADCVNHLTGCCLKFDVACHALRLIFELDGRHFQAPFSGQTQQNSGVTADS